VKCCRRTATARTHSLAIAYVSADDIDLYVDWNQVVDARNMKDNLIQAIRDGNIDVLRANIAAAANVNARDEMGLTPLMVAAYLSDANCVEALIAAGADVNAADGDGDTVLMCALNHSRSVACAKLLIAAGADVRARNKRGYTALMMAASIGYAEGIKVLLAAGADANARDTDGDTALISTLNSNASHAEPGEIDETVKALLAAGANVNVKTRSGNTALILAANNKHVNSIETLLIAGANIDANENLRNNLLALVRQHPGMPANLIYSLGRRTDRKP